ncbi:FAD-dependent monooxygenase [Nocardiopsis suaedae]|uniref:FAD-dependent monooxygenase n=1 Tax=Nocardiopsis suaedae TaxID=3018444 RepID=A0ABT4TRD2_9ACTN|nr:FAD-dependent monooxygenase [Nocardiopsis suaedae]MDA2807243.1 FAD-dependent monooxygenase [Nocardiopsis suaedae]
MSSRDGNDAGAPGRPERAHPPVIVVGAGPVGLTAALALARARVACTVLEAEDERGAAYFRSTGSKAICFQRDVLDVFDRLGVGERIIAEGTTWTTARTYYKGHEVRTVTFPAGGGEGLLPPWINISQARVEEELLAAVTAHPDIDLRFGHRVVGIVQDGAPGGDGDEPRGGGGGPAVVEAEAPGGTVRMRAEYLVGADGPRSAVRTLTGVAFPGDSFGDRFLICDIRADLPFPNERRFHFDPEWNPGRQVLVHQCPDSTWRIDWQVPDGFDLDAERRSGALDERIRKIVGDGGYTLVWSSVYRFHERCAERMRTGRVLLAGDAAHLYAPFGARGLNSGVQDAENLAWKIACALRVHDPAAADALLETYHSERWAAARENLRVTGDTMRFLVPHTEEDRRRRREVLERALEDPRAGDRIDSGRLAEPFRYADSPLTTPGGPVPPQTRPEAPAPGDICPDALCTPVGAAEGERVRLRSLLGPGFTIVADRNDDAVDAARACAGLPADVAPLALERVDAYGDAAEALGHAKGSLFAVRPDAHLCAVLPPGTPPDRVRSAIERACGARAPARRGR